MIGVCEGECMGRCLGDETLTLMRCYSCEVPHPYEALEGGNPFKSIKRKISFSYILV